MTDQQKIDFKNTLKKKCIEIIEQRIHASLNAMQQAQAAANEEEKSSAGDKYETGRSMNQLDKDMHTTQLASHKNDMNNLLAVNCSVLYETIQAGSFVKCSGAFYFIAAGLDKMSIDNKTVFLLSPLAPLATSLYLKKSGDAVLFNSKSLQVEEVY